jgi:hypothetical protein
MAIAGIVVADVNRLYMQILVKLVYKNMTNFVKNGTTSETSGFRCDEKNTF